MKKEFASGDGNLFEEMPMHELNSKGTNHFEQNDIQELQEHAAALDQKKKIHLQLKRKKKINYLQE